jgi:hypothetical protein
MNGTQKNLGKTKEESLGSGNAWEKVTNKGGMRKMTNKLEEK